MSGDSERELCGLRFLSGLVSADPATLCTGGKKRDEKGRKKNCSRPHSALRAHDNAAGYRTPDTPQSEGWEGGNYHRILCYCNRTQRIAIVIVVEALERTVFRHSLPLQ